MQLIYTGKTKRSHPKHEFPAGFHVTQTENLWSNTEKSIEYFNKVIFPQIKKIKESLSNRCLYLLILILGQIKLMLRIAGIQ